VNYIRFPGDGPLSSFSPSGASATRRASTTASGSLRPLLIDNIILVAGLAASRRSGLPDIYGARTLWQAFAAATLTF